MGAVLILETSPDLHGPAWEFVGDRTYYRPTDPQWAEYKARRWTA